MTVQTIKKNKSPEWAVIPYDEYLKLVEKAEMLEDIQEFDREKSALERGETETIPSAVAYSLLDGENSIRVWREYRGLSQEQLAYAAEISIPYLSQLETGKRKGSMRVLVVLANLLNLTIDDLVDR